MQRKYFIDKITVPALESGDLSAYALNKSFMTSLIVPRLSYPHTYNVVHRP